MTLPATTPTTAAPPPAAPRSASPPARTSRRRLLTDRLARWVVTLGGLGIIASILGILFFILAEVWPLLGEARVAAADRWPLPQPAIAIVTDEHQSHVAVLGRDGVVRARRLADGQMVLEQDLVAAAGGGPAVPILAAIALPSSSRLAAALADGSVAVAPLTWEVTFDPNQARNVVPSLGAADRLPVDPAGRPLGAFAAAVDPESGSLLVAAQLERGPIALVGRRTSENLITGEVTTALERHEISTDRPLSALLLDQDGGNLYAGTATGEVLWWPLAAGTAGDAQVARAGGAAVTALTLLIGDRALVVGQADGGLSIWFLVPQEDGEMRLQRVREFPPHPGAIRLLAASQRNKGFLAQDESGLLGLYYSTSRRTVWRGASPLQPAQALAFSPKADGAFLAGERELQALSIDNPHPEVTPKALFGKVWYEGYERPEYVWQSTGGTDDFESKLSLTPLLVGTLKGTVFSLLLAIPLGVLSAMYASQFMHPRLLRYVKPTVEIMAALPSVVLGFLAGLWLAPRVERAFAGLVLMALVLPALVLAAGWGWARVPRRLRGRFLSGSEVWLYVAALALGMWGCFALAPAFERFAFGGNFQAWLLSTTGLPYDQRNAVVVGLAMGFAVIPIIFAISEDAFSNVPKNLVSGSLALGANRWQTVTRVVLPTASPGIFSAIMVGFGRAVGETMIVLMATGNTPIMSWNPFNGFRTLSANIAVEIPEAPHGSTLYRTLFLAALLLFAVTFLVNTAAELVRQRLRRRYAEL